MKAPDSNFFHPTITEGSLTLSEEESHHAIKVCRANVGDILKLSDGMGTLANAKITQIDKKTCTVHIESKTIFKRTRHLHLGIACLKDDANEEVALHASEADLESIILLRTDYSQEPKNCNLERIIRRSELKARVSLKQSQKPFETKIQGPFVFKEWLKNVSGYIILCDIDGAYEVPKEIKESIEPVTILVGPEGGFSKQEIEAVKTINTAKVFTLALGNTRLRARTAALFALGKLI